MSVWITKAEGLLHKVGDKEYSNEKFVSSIKKSKSPMSKLIMGNFPYPTHITLQGSIPTSWTEFDDEQEINISEVEDLLVFQPRQIPGDKRLMLSRGKISAMVNDIAPHAGLVVTPRGIKSNPIPTDPNECIKELIYSVMFLVEKHATASLKTKNKKLSKDKREKVIRVSNIFAHHGNVLDVSLVSSYVEPSPTIANKLYILGAIYGTDIVNTIVNDIYYRCFSDHVRAVVEMGNIAES